MLLYSLWVNIQPHPVIALTLAQERVGDRGDESSKGHDEAKNPHQTHDLSMAVLGTPIVATKKYRGLPSENHSGWLSNSVSIKETTNPRHVQTLKRIPLSEDKVWRKSHEKLQRFNFTRFDNPTHL